MARPMAVNIRASAPAPATLRVGMEHGGDELDETRKPPPHSCDCHTHVFGPSTEYPFDPGRTYTPGEASVDDLLALHAALGIDRVVIVQPSPYGTDNRCTLDAVRRLGDRARAVAVISPDWGRDRLEALGRAGVRGIRLNLETAGVHDPAAAKTLFRRAAEQVGPLGWHIQVFTSLAMLAALRQALSGLDVPVVVDHFGRASATGEPGFDALLALVEAGRAWVKLSAPHRAARSDDVLAVARALITANPERMLWGTDWPHPGGGQRTGAERDQVAPFQQVDDLAALNCLYRWAGDDAMVTRILVDNPATLYGFG